MSYSTVHPMHPWDYLDLIGVPEIPPRTSPFDPGYDPLTVASHLEQSAHLMSSLKISMACWQIATEDATRRKIAAARRFEVPVCMGGGPFEVAAEFGKLAQYFELCASMGATRIEAGAGFAKVELNPVQICREAAMLGLEVQFEIGGKPAARLAPM